MKATDWQEVIGTIGLFVLVWTVVAMLIWQFGAAWRARAYSRQAAQFQELAVRAVLAQENTDRQLIEHGRALTDLQARLRAVEYILKDAE
jgi:hypothetical protein